jgi:PrcB C-terminal
VIAAVLAVSLVTATTVSHEGSKNHEEHEALSLEERLRDLRAFSWLRDRSWNMQQSADAPRTIDKGEQSNIDEARQVVLRTDADWTKLWQQHSPDRQRPAVDFSKDMIVGVFMGSRSSAGYNISIVSTFAKDGNVLVRYQESTPRPGTMTAQVLTFPYHLVAIPKAAGEVRFEKVQ